MSLKSKKPGSVIAVVLLMLAYVLLGARCRTDSLHIKLDAEGILIHDVVTTSQPESPKEGAHEPDR